MFRPPVVSTPHRFYQASPLSPCCDGEAASAISRSFRLPGPRPTGAGPTSVACRSAARDARAGTSRGTTVWRTTVGTIERMRHRLYLTGSRGDSTRCSGSCQGHHNIKGQPAQAQIPQRLAGGSRVRPRAENCPDICAFSNGRRKWAERGGDGVLSTADRTSAAAARIGRRPLP